jgi:spore germination cell wall hydrolase CwlJ-like protein
MPLGEKTMVKHSLRGIISLMGLMLIVLLTATITSTKMESLQKEQPIAATEIKQSKTLTANAEQIKRDLDCLALNIYREAALEPFEGKVGVAQVTLNRTRSEDFPNTVCGVVYQKNKFVGRVVCQFSWYCDRRHRTRAIDPEQYAESYRVAKMVYVEDFKLEKLEDAIYYHADYVNPRWGKEKITKIGRHIFYRG